MVNKIDSNSQYTYTGQKKIGPSQEFGPGQKFGHEQAFDQNGQFAPGEKVNQDETIGPDTKDKELSSKSKAKKAAGGSDGDNARSLECGGVKLELSGGGQNFGTGSQAPANEAKAQKETIQTSILETIRNFVMAAVAAVTDFLQKIWNDPQPEEDPLETPQPMITVEEISEESDVSPADEASLEEEQISSTAEEIHTTEQSMPEDRSHPINQMLLEREIKQSLQDGDMEQVIRLLTDNGRKTIAKNSTLLTSYDKNGRVVEPGASVRERVLHGDRNTWKQ